MFWRIAWFEIRFWLRSWMLWVFFGVIGLLVFTAVSTPNLTLFFVLTNTKRNAPFVIQKLGTINDLENNVIHPQIDGIFRAQVSKSPAISYQQNRAEEQSAADQAVRARQLPRPGGHRAVRPGLPPRLADPGRGVGAAARGQPLTWQRRKDASDDRPPND